MIRVVRVATRSSSTLTTHDLRRFHGQNMTVGRVFRPDRLAYFVAADHLGILISLQSYFLPGSILHDKDVTIDKAKSRGERRQRTNFYIPFRNCRNALDTRRALL